MVVESVTMVGFKLLPVGSTAGDVRLALTPKTPPPLSLTVQEMATWFWPSTPSVPFKEAVVCWARVGLKGTLIQCEPGVHEEVPTVVRSKDNAPCAAGATGSLQAVTRPNSPSAHVHESFQAILIRASFRWCPNRGSA
jgi:hypothetical protein